MINLNDEGVVQEIFEKQIEPHLFELGEQRESALHEAAYRWKKASLLGIVPAALVTFLLTYYLLDLETISVVVSCVAVIIVGAFCVRSYANQSSGAYESELRDRFMLHACEALGDLSYSRVGTSFDLTDFKKYQVVPQYTKAELEDKLDGSHRGFEFSIVEAVLTKETATMDDERSYRDEEMIFEGLLVKLRSPLKSHGRVSICKDKGKVINKISGWLVPGERVEIPNADFESLYEVYAEAPEMVFTLLTPSVIEYFVRLPEILNAEWLNITVDGDLMLISIYKQKPFLEGFSVNTDSLHYRLLFEDVVRECTFIAQIIDNLIESAE